MSWGGPAVGTAPHQPPSFSNGQPSYSQQQPYQYGQQQQQPYGQYQGQPSYPQSGPPQRPPDNRPPKKKGNPIITRYPPPPGYRGPAQPQGPYPPNQYQPPPQGYAQGYAAPQNYPPQGYQAPTNYPPTPAYSPQSYGPPQNYPPQPNYPQPQPPPQNYQYPQQGYQSGQGYSQPPSYPDAQGYAPPQSTYQGYPPQPAPVNPSQQPHPPQHGWQPPSNQAPYPSHDSYGSYSGAHDPNATPTPSSAHPATAQQTPTSAHPESASSENGEKPQLFLAWDDWDFDFDGAIWPKSNEPVDPNLSLGVIIWRPAKQVTRALPSTFDEAEEQALKPPAEKLGNGESVSIYFTADNSHEAFLDVRQTDEWYTIKDDPIFVVFPDEKDMDLIPLDECIAKRDRPDEPLEEPKHDEDEKMQDSTWNVMDNLEQALSGQSDDPKPPPPPPSIKQSESHPSRDQRQEDVLAMLGVTGAPKPPSDELMSFPFPSQEFKPPASLPEKPPVPPVSHIPPRPEQPPQRAHSYGGHRSTSYGAPPPQRPYGSLSSSDRRRPPPPPPPDGQEYDPWNPRTGQNPPNSLSTKRSFEGSGRSPARSEGSNHTLAGSDFEADKPTNGSNGIQASPSAPSSVTTPSLQRSDSSFNRKRSYDDADHDEGQTRQQGDHSKRKRRSEIESAYSRR